MDGFNLTYVVTPGTFADVVEYVVPELQARGAYPTAYEPGTLRESCPVPVPDPRLSNPARTGPSAPDQDLDDVPARPVWVPVWTGRTTLRLRQAHTQAGP